MKLVLAQNSSPSQLIIYQIQDGKTRLEVRLDKETWRKILKRRWKIKTIASGQK